MQKREGKVDVVYVLETRHCPGPVYVGTLQSRCCCPLHRNMQCGLGHTCHLSEPQAS